MKTGKRAICAGPGNPPVVVDDCPGINFDKVARNIILGGGFDNNLLCIGEKQIFAVDQSYKKTVDAMVRNGAFLLNASQLETIKKEVFTFREDDGGCSHPVVNREFVGADAAKLARIAGLDIDPTTEMLIAETAEDDLFVIEGADDAIAANHSSNLLAKPSVWPGIRSMVTSIQPWFIQ